MSNKTVQQDIETAVIIPNYNGLKFMEDCMSALKSQTYASFKLIVVDNGSTDGSAEYLRTLKSAQDIGRGVEVIFLNENTGFPGAVNTGIYAAGDVEYVVLLNNDTKVSADYLEELIAPFKKRRGRKIAAVSPKMIQMYKPELIDDAGDGYTTLGWAFQRGVGQSVYAPKFNKRTEIFSACAGASAYRKSVLEEIKYSEGIYFDPLHFAYLEDVDVSFRMRIHGYRIVYAPESVVYHVGSGTSGSKYNDFKVRLAARNNIYLIYKNMPLFMLLINLPEIVIGIIVKQIFFIKRGFGRAYFKGVAEGLRSVEKCEPHKTYFDKRRVFTYLKLEFMLVADTFSYVADFIQRRKHK